MYLFLSFQDPSHFGSASLSMLASQCSKVGDPMGFGHQDAMKNPYMTAWGMPAGIVKLFYYFYYQSAIIFQRNISCIESWNMSGQNNSLANFHQT